MQPRFTVGILVLKAEGLVSSAGYVGFTLQFASTVIIAEPNEIAVLISHLSWNADLVAVEVVGLLAAFASEGVAFYGNAAVVVAFAVAALSVGIESSRFSSKPYTSVRPNASVTTVWSLR